MPFDTPRWQIDIAAVDKTATAFSSVDKRMKALQASTGAFGGAGAAAMGKLNSALATLAAGFTVAAIAHKVWEAGMKAGDLGEQAEQVGLTTDALQAYRFQAAQNGVEVEKLDGAMMRLTNSMGQAEKGGKDQIELFQRLGVNILNANGELRGTGDVLPEVAQGLLKIGSESQRNALMIELLGKSGARMVTMLKDWAGGNDKLIAGVRAQGGILDAEAIDKWDKVGDAMKRASLASDVTYAKLGAPIALVGLQGVETALKGINSQFDELSKSVALINTHRGALAQIMEVVNILTFGIGARVVGKDAFTRATEGIDKARAAAVEADVELQRLQSAAGQTGMGYRYESAIEAQRKRAEAAKADVADAEEVLRRVKEGPYTVTMPPVTVTGDRGVSNPTPKGGTDPYAKAIESAKEYTALKNAETAAVGLGVQEAARMKHEQELINKASSDSNKLLPAQIENLKALAAGMAEADANFTGAKFIDDFKTKGEEFIAQQQVERDTLYMSQQAAMAYRLEQEAMNRARVEGITLTPGYIETIKQISAAQAEAAEQTRKAKEWADFEKETFKGFFSDISQSLRDGANVWDAFGKAGENALGKIADKLLDMALNDLWSAAFPAGAGGGGGGFLSGILGSLFSGGGGLAGSGVLFADGGNPPVGTPYIVGERGPEVRIDRRPGTIYNRRQWNAMGGGSSGGRVDIYVHEATDLLRLQIDNQADARIVRATPQLMSSTLDQVPGKMAQHNRDTAGGDHRLG